ncbi:MAG: GNAT family N-acetyltransferase [Candidatus Thorarchaeota archaeon]|jgi:GNAT superfamily N-acetyltransferase
MGRFVRFDQGKHQEQFVELNIEFLSWSADEMIARYDIDIRSLMGITAREYVETNYEDFVNSYEKDGIIYILEIDDVAMGMGGLRKQVDGICEIKRMYIRPEYRGSGYGKILFRKLIEYAKSVGYSRVRLESGIYMETAHHIYRSHGFKECKEYPGRETPEPFIPYTIFMEKNL